MGMPVNESGTPMVGIPWKSMENVMGPGTGDALAPAHSSATAQATPRVVRAGAPGGGLWIRIRWWRLWIYPHCLRYGIGSRLLDELILVSSEQVSRKRCAMPFKSAPAALSAFMNQIVVGSPCQGTPHAMVATRVRSKGIRRMEGRSAPGHGVVPACQEEILVETIM